MYRPLATDWRPTHAQRHRSEIGKLVAPFSSRLLPSNAKPGRWPLKKGAFEAGPPPLARQVPARRVGRECSIGDAALGCAGAKALTQCRARGDGALVVRRNGSFLQHRPADRCCGAIRRCLRARRHRSQRRRSPACDRQRAAPAAAADPAYRSRRSSGRCQLFCFPPPAERAEALAAATGGASRQAMSMTHGRLPSTSRSRNVAAALISRGCCDAMR